MFKFFLSTFLFTAPLFCEDIVIIGSGPSGLTAGIYAARSDYSTLIIEGDDSGGQITKSYKVENFPGFPEGISGYDLYQNMKKQALKFNAKFSPERVKHIDLSLSPYMVELESGEKIYAKALILASGLEKKWLGIPNEKELIGRGVNACALCDGPFFKGKEVAVVGGGDSALEDAIYLSNFASKVTIIHRSNSLRASKYLQNLAKKNEKIDFLLEHSIEELNSTLDNSATKLVLQNEITKKSSQITVDALFVAIGNKPNNDIIPCEIETDKDGYVIRKEGTTKTSIEGVFAAGDVSDSRYKQAITAAGMGAMSAIDAIRFLQEKGDQK
jgi:thioredoxin reductase (NADPH)